MDAGTSECDKNRNVDELTHPRSEVPGKTLNEKMQVRRPRISMDACHYSSH